jgi:hypothetical protein
MDAFSVGILDVRGDASSHEAESAEAGFPHLWGSQLLQNTSLTPAIKQFQ